MLVGKAKSLPLRGISLKCTTWVGSSLFRKHYAKMERLASDKHSSLLRTFVNYGHKKFYNIGPWKTLLKLDMEADRDMLARLLIRS
jgi:hypothetical protein